MVFKENEANLSELLNSREVHSVDKVFELRNRKRRTHTESLEQNLCKKINLEQFVETESPYGVFVDCNQILISPQDKEKYLSVLSMPADMQDNCKDLLLLGKREITNLIKWRAKLRDSTA